MKTVMILAGALAMGTVAPWPQMARASAPAQVAPQQLDRDVRSDVTREDVKFDDLPGEVKDAIGREAKDEMVDRVERLTSGKHHVIYRAIVSRHGKDDKRVIVVDEHGKVLADQDLDEWMEKEK